MSQETSSPAPDLEPPVSAPPAPPAARGPAARQPLAGVAWAAVAGVLLAEIARRWLLPPAGGGDWLAWTGDAVFLATVCAFCARPRVWAFWLLAVAGFAALHLFHADPVPAARLADRLALPGGNGDPTHVVQAVGTVRGKPRALPSRPLPAVHHPPSAPAADPPPSWRFQLDLETAAVDGDAWPSRARVDVEWRDGPRALAEGDRLTLTGLAANLAVPRNPGEFDRAALQRRRGVRSAFRVTGLADGRVLAPGDRSPWRLAALAARLHDAMEDTLRADLQDDPDAGAVVSTMLLGLRDDPGLGELEPVFQRTGTLHYFAIDGLKLGLVASLLLRFLLAVGLPRVWAGTLILPVLAAYTLATGLGAASARALLVAAVLLGGHWLDRPARPLNSLGAAALLILGFDTNQLFEVGFQLTFLVVLAILTLGPPLRRWLGGWGALDPFVPPEVLRPPRAAVEWLRLRACDLFAVAVTAWVGSLPVMAWYFGLVSPVSPLANVAAFPFAFAVLALGVLSLAGAWASQAWVTWMNNANWIAAHALLFVARGCDAVPGGSLHLTDPSAWRWGRRPLTEITILDLGRSRGAFVRAGTTDWLVDTGRLVSYARSVRPCLRAYGVQRLDGGLILTQPDAEHLSAAPLAWAEFSPARVIDAAVPTRSLFLRDFRRLLTVVGGRKAETLARRGDVFALAPAVGARVLYPPDDPPPPAPVTAARRALVPQIRVATVPGRRDKEWRVLLLPDGTDGAAARWLVANEAPETLQSAVLVADAPLSEEVVRAIRPQLIILRSSREIDAPPEGAAPPTLPGVTIMAQEESGAVNVRIYRDRIEARGFVDGQMVEVREGAAPAGL